MNACVYAFGQISVARGGNNVHIFEHSFTMAKTDVTRLKRLNKTMEFLSPDLKDVFFCCDLERCKGACCIEGDAGAPLEEEEIARLDDHIERIKPFMIPEGIAEVDQTGVFDYDDAGKFVTPLIRQRECAYVCFEGPVARCAIEAAFRQGAIPFAKPLSCHLYPVRITQLSYGEALNYHQWHICRPALEKGRQENQALYLFLRDALERKYGKTWYSKLVRRFR
jgi:hypothetical protein